MTDNPQNDKKQAPLSDKIMIKYMPTHNAIIGEKPAQTFARLYLVLSVITQLLKFTVVISEIKLSQNTITGIKLIIACLYEAMKHEEQKKYTAQLKKQNAMFDIEEPSKPNDIKKNKHFNIPFVKSATQYAFCNPLITNSNKDTSNNVEFVTNAIDELTEIHKLHFNEDFTDSFDQGVKIVKACSRQAIQYVAAKHVTEQLKPKT